jgi:hypothetical protein
MGGIVILTLALWGLAWPCIAVTWYRRANVAEERLRKLRELDDRMSRERAAWEKAGEVEG